MHCTILSVPSKFSISRLMAWMMAIFMVTSLGCGPQRDVAEVTGVVLMDGKPMDLIHIEFWSKNGPRSYGKTDAEGKFVLQIDDKSRQSLLANNTFVCEIPGQPKTITSTREVHGSICPMEKGVGSTRSTTMRSRVH